MIGMQIQLGVAWGIILLSVFAMVCRAPTLVWICFFLAIFWMSLAIVFWGVYLPTGKAMDDMCDVLPDRSDDGVPNTFAEVALPIGMTDRKTVLTVVTTCLETKDGDLLKAYNYSKDNITSQFPKTDLNSVAGVKEFLAMDIVSRLNNVNDAIVPLNSIKDSKDHKLLTSLGLSYKYKQLLAVVAKPTTDTKDMRAGVALQESLTQLEKDINATVEDTATKMISQGLNCTRAGDNWNGAKLAACEGGVGGSIDIVWFSLFLTVIAFFFWTIVIAKLTKRLDPHPEELPDIRKPLVPKDNVDMAPYQA